MFVKLNLPGPSDRIKDAIYRIADSSSYELELKKTHDKVQNYTVNSVSRKFVEDDSEFNQLVKDEYSKYFNETIHPAVGIVTNLKSSEVSCWPPHSDRVRIFALNFYLDEGGEHVETVMYNTHDNYIAGPGTGKIYNYNDLEIDKIYHLKINQWYGLNVRQVHSIENIESRRIIFTISFHDFTFFDFIEKYKNLLIAEETYIKK